MGILYDLTTMGAIRRGERMSSRTRFSEFLNKIGSSKASAQLKIVLALAVFGIAIALLISGIHAETDVKEQRNDITDEKGPLNEESYRYTEDCEGKNYLQLR